MAVSKIFGAAVKRREDPRLITGRATYTDDVKLPNLAYVAFVRSPHAHARITRIDVSRAQSAPGVVAVVTGQDLVGKVNGIPTAWLIPNSDLKTPTHPAIAVDTVRYVGDAVAAVVAESRAAASDATELVDVEYDPLPVVVDQEKATQPGAPQLHPDVPNNVAFRWTAKGGDVDAAFRAAEVTIKQRLINQRLIPNAIETRNTVAQYNPGTGDLTVTITSQNPHIHRFLLSVILGLPEHRIRVVAPEVGGGFGSKIHCYPEEAVASFLAIQLDRPIKWTEDRRENYLATIHGRDHITDLELAAKRDGTILGIRGRTYANLGAYLSTAAPGIPTILHGLMMTGPYQIAAQDYEVVGVFTNTTPVDAYRGAGRPEATYAVERLVDLLAAEIKLDPVEIRRKNFIPKSAFPHTVASGLVYDSGDYDAALDKALQMVNYQQFRSEQAAARQKGRYLGIGFSTYVEICGLGPSAVAGAVGFQGGLWDNANVRIHPSGKATVFTGTSPHGQGEETTFAQIVAEELGLPLDDIEVVHGDTARIAMGWGTYGSRSTAVGGSAMVLAARKVKEKARIIAAHLLEASPEDIEFVNGRFQVKGVPERSKSIQDIALMANLAWNMPKGIEPGLEESSFFDPSNFVYPFGTHVAIVEIDPGTGVVKLVRYVAVDDCGIVINPKIVDGQVHGGVAQGVAQALWEAAVYDANGQLLTGSLMDYAIPTAEVLPSIETARTETPSPVNPLGLKGVGETGTIASTPAVVNAVVDALAPLGVRHVDMPLTPEKIWRLLPKA
ncbi:MAG TPA: molybdopterin cofactor-binding domain-containing protein [Chloroflexota bacterium]|nr:molybdopterin cofactor-binding domain-containing protein [Chloroflexota bacterium]